MNEQERLDEYTARLRTADPALIAPWLTKTCPECDAVPGPGDRKHLFAADGSVVVGCRGYLVIPPAALGMDRRGWEDWHDWDADALPEGWAEWTSPNGVVHAIPPAGPCATCGKQHQAAPEDGAAAALAAAGLTANEMASVLAWLARRAPAAVTEALARVDAARQASGSKARGNYAVHELLPPPAHTGMAAHDGYEPHSHEVRPDHLGVAREELRPHRFEATANGIYCDTCGGSRAGAQHIA